MKYCTECGHELADGIKFCSECGNKVNIEKSKDTVLKDGTVHKCPVCGEQLDSFVLKCPACGYELRGAKSSSSVREFASKVQEIEFSRPKKKLNISMGISATDEKLVSLIRNFVIPNTKEDLLEFMVLASSNINLKRYNLFNKVSESQKMVSDAWEAKFEQAYNKAQLTFEDSVEFSKINDIYSKKSNEINRRKRGKSNFWLKVIAVPLALFVAFIVLGISITTVENKKIEEENNKLNAIVLEVYEAINQENYVLARAKTATLVFAEDDWRNEDKWDKTREEMLKVIDEAEKKNTAQQGE